MEGIEIKGPTRLEGVVETSGAKNAALPILAATILARGAFVIRNVPDVADVSTMLRILRALGAKTSFLSGTATVDTSALSKNVAEYKYVKTMRASVCLLGPLLARFGAARVSMPGGCVIGPRPIDLHIKGLRALGARVELDHGYVAADTAKGLRGGRVYLGGAFGSSVLATVNVVMAAALSRGRSVIENAACEPEVVDFCSFLAGMGAKINGIGSPLVGIEGTKKLTPCEYTIISDRIEAGSYMIAAAMTKGDVTVRNVNPVFLGAIFDRLAAAGVDLSVKNSSVRVRRRRRLKPVTVTTLAYPGFPTDLQAQMMALMAVTPGISVITERIFPERFMHVGELNRMGANIRLEGSSAIVNGVEQLSAAQVMASDLRASAALVLAGLAARGETIVERVYHLDRGYEKLVDKLRALGARIKRVKLD